jgi:hypothetical protein
MGAGVGTRTLIDHARERMIRDGNPVVRRGG